MQQINAGSHLVVGGQTRTAQTEIEKSSAIVAVQKVGLRDETGKMSATKSTSKSKPASIGQHHVLEGKARQSSEQWPKRDRQTMYQGKLSRRKCNGELAVEHQSKFRAKAIESS